MNVAVDTNILLSVSGARQLNNESALDSCTNAVDRLLEHGFNPCISFQNLVEFYAVATKAVSANGYALSVDVVINWIESILKTYTLLPDAAGTIDIWKSLCLKYQPRGKHIHDVRLAANALANEVSYYLTSDPEDYKFTELKVITPASVLEDRITE